MTERDDDARDRDHAETKRDVEAAIEDKFAEDGDAGQAAREDAARERWDAAEDRRAAARDRDEDERD